MTSPFSSASRGLVTPIEPVAARLRATVALPPSARETSYSIAFGRNATTGTTHTGSVAIGSGTATTAANQVHVGGRTVSGVAAGSLSATSTEAVNGSQLFATNQAVSGLDTRVDALESLALDFDDRLDRVDDRASAGTAVAIALGGNGFIPGKQFNITGNVGTYRGASAGALQIGAMIGENMAVNAGIATGFNKGGKVGARAGITFGW